MAYRESKFTKTDPKTGRRVSMWTPQREARVYTLYCKKKLSMQDTATLIGCSLAAVQQLLERKGWNRRIKNHKRITMQQMDLRKNFFAELYRSKSAQQIATEYKFSLRGVIAWLKENQLFENDHRVRVHKARAQVQASGATKRGLARIQAILDFPNWDSCHPADYRKAIHKVTGFSWKKYRGYIDPEGVRSYEMHLDHIFSIKAALCKLDFGVWVPRKRRAPIWMVAHPANLRVIEREENISRHASDPDCHSIRNLVKRIKRFNRKYGNPFEKFGYGNI